MRQSESHLERKRKARTAERQRARLQRHRGQAEASCFYSFLWKQEASCKCPFETRLSFSLPDAPENPPIKTNPSSLLPSCFSLSPVCSLGPARPSSDRTKKPQQRLCGFRLALSSFDAPKGNKKTKNPRKSLKTHTLLLLRCKQTGRAIALSRRTVEPHQTQMLILSGSSASSLLLIALQGGKNITPLIYLLCQRTKDDDASTRRSRSLNYNHQILLALLITYL